MATKQATRGDPEVGARIREIRNWKGLTLKELALRAKFDQPNLSKLETGQIGFSAESIRRIAKALDVPVSYLFTKTPLPIVYQVPFRNEPDRPMQAISRQVSAQAFAFEVTEDALGTIIQPGDIVICEPQRPLKMGKFVVARLQDQLIVRRVKMVKPPTFGNPDPKIEKQGFMHLNIEEPAVFDLFAEDPMIAPIRFQANYEDTEPKCEILGAVILRITDMLDIPQ